MKKDFDQDELIIKKLSESLSSPEADAFQELYASDEAFYEAFTSYKQIWEGAAGLEVPLGLAKEERWEKLNAQLEEKSALGKHLNPWFVRIAAVISLLLFAGAFFFFFRETPALKTITTANGEIKTLELPDLSTIILNAGAIVKYDPSDWDKERIIYLEGEAYFDVVKTGAPFVVFANDAKVQVLGTSFAIKSSIDKVEISCTSGKVGVNTIDGEGTGKRLQKGDGIQLNNSELGETYAINIDRVAVWRSGELIFEDMPLPEVFNMLELYFDTHIALREKGARENKIDKLSFTGKFENPQLNETLKTICLSAGLNYKSIDQHHILIY